MCPAMEGRSAFIVVTDEELQDALSREIDITQMTDEEFKEVSAHVRRALQSSLSSVVRDALSHLSYGGSQVRLARAGGYPCEWCPDCYLGPDGSCMNENECRAWSIYENQY